MRPSLKELQQRISQDLQVGQFPQSFVAHLSNSLAGAFHMLYAHTELSLAKLLPDSATGTALERWGHIWNVFRKPAKAASGSITIETFGPVDLKAGTTLTSGTAEYALHEALTSETPGKFEVKVTALTPGSATNLKPQSILKFSETASNVASEASVISLDGGADLEAEEDFRGRILFAIQHPPQGGSVIDYLNWISSVPGVHRAFVKTASLEKPGVVGFSFITKDGKQEVAIRQKLETFLQDLAPCGVTVEFIEFKFVKLDVEFSIHPPTIRGAAKAELRKHLINSFTPKGLYSNNMQRSQGVVHLSELTEVLSSVEGEEYHLIQKPIEHSKANPGEFYVVD